VTAELSIYLEDLVSKKTVRSELRKSNIHGRASIVKPLISESHAQMRKEWCHDHKHLDIRQLETRTIWSNESSLTLFPTSGRVYDLRTHKEAYNPECLFPTVKHGGGSGIVWAVISWYSVLLFSLVPFMDELLQEVHVHVG
jgi:hypothetical protein